MKNITIKEAQIMSSPNPFALIVSKSMENIINIMGVSWLSYVSNNPPKLMICISKKCKTNENIIKNQEFCVCFPNKTIKDIAWKCSITSGNDINKVEKYKVDLMCEEDYNIPYVKQSKIIYMCKVDKILEEGNHNIIIGEILLIKGNKNMQQLYAVDGYKKLKTVKV